MKWFWYSLFVFILFMCSCKSKKVAAQTDFEINGTQETEWVSFSALTDTFCRLRIKVDKSKLRVIETLTIVEYDKESGKPTKETNAKREIAQDTDKVASEEEQKGSEAHQGDSLNHIREVTQKMESETETVTECNGLSSFGKWLGIVIGLAIVSFIAYSYIKRKLRIN